MDTICIRGARTHNLQNIDIDLPRNRLIVITGLSGSGKSSLAFDTLYAEGQRRYVESLSTYARQFLAVMTKPDVDHIDGLSPAIAIQQKSTSHNPRSTVGTVTEIHDYLRLLFARVGIPHCPIHQRPLQAQTVSQMVDHILALPKGERLMLLAPLHRHADETLDTLLRRLKHQGFLRVRLAGEVLELDDVTTVDDDQDVSLEVVVDRFRVREDLAVRLAESLATALHLGRGVTRVGFLDGGQADVLLSANYACPLCDFRVDSLEPALFSFNNPVGACPDCEGLGEQAFFDPQRIISQPSASLADGAIRHWDRHNSDYFQLIQTLSQHYHFSVDSPFEALPTAIQHLVLYGSGDEELIFYYPDASGHTTAQTHPFEGVIPNLERRYREANSPSLRDELANYRHHRRCPSCQGSRLNATARHVRVATHTLPELSILPLQPLQAALENLALLGQRATIAAPILTEIHARLGFLLDVGLSYLHLQRSAHTLSGGEAQRIRLASQIGVGLVGVLYVLDEPSIGLHQRDNERLLQSLIRLRDLGNTVVVVEHDEEAIRQADYVVDMGPGPGVHGGRVVASGPPSSLMNASESLTGQYLAGRRHVALSTQRHEPDPARMLCLRGARGHNLRGVDLHLPLGLMTCVSGVSGSGKSTLINHTLLPVMTRYLHGGGEDSHPYDEVTGLEHLDKVIAIDQSPIGRTPRSNPATYTGLLAPIRELFAATPEARSRGYTPGRFSFNVRGGRCEACQGDGLIRVEMHFLPDVYVTCDVCEGQRYNRETLEIRYRGQTIHDVLQMTVETAEAFFAAIPAVVRRLRALLDVGLPYLRLGQSATTLSGGEAQRVKLARELAKRDTGNTLYILDEPTTGLHFHDIAQLLQVLHALRDRGNTVVVIEHNLDVIKTADWVVDLGPEGGTGGGEILVTGTPVTVAACQASHTGRFLGKLLEG